MLIASSTAMAGPEGSEMEYLKMELVQCTVILSVSWWIIESGARASKIAGVLDCRHHDVYV